MSDTEGEEKCAGSLPPLSDEGISDTIEVHQRVDILDGDMNVVMANCGKVSFVGVLPAMDEEGKTWVGVDLDRPLDDYAPCDVRHLAELPWHFFPLAGTLPCSGGEQHQPEGRPVKSATCQEKRSVTAPSTDGALYAVKQRKNIN